MAEALRMTVPQYVRWSRDSWRGPRQARRNLDRRLGEGPRLPGV